MSFLDTVLGISPEKMSSTPSLEYISRILSEEKTPKVSVLCGYICKMLKEMQEDKKILAKELSQGKELKQEVCELKSKVEKLENELKNKSGGKILETTKKEIHSYVEAVKKNLSKEKPETKKVSMDLCGEMSEQEHRRLNLVLRGVKESDKEEGDERKKDDMEAAINLFVKMEVATDTQVRYEIKETYRLGRQEAGKRYRPLLIKLTTMDLKDEFLRSKHTMKDYNKVNNTRYRVDPDITKMQRERLSILKKDAEEKTKKEKNGEKWFVWGSKDNPKLKKMTTVEIKRRGWEV